MIDSPITIQSEKDQRLLAVKQKQKNADKVLQSNLNRLYINIGISIVFMLAELLGGILSGSLAILTDAAHILSDILGFTISIISLKITRKPASELMTFGYHRSEIIGALLSILIIWGLTGWLLYKAILRIIVPMPTDGFIMLITAIGGLVGNTIMGVVLINTKKKSQNDQIEIVPFKASLNELMDTPLIKPNSTSLNMKAAALHVLGDWIQSIGVIIAGIIVYFQPDYIIADPICTIVFAVLVMITTWPIVRDSIKIRMERAPEDIDSIQLVGILREV